MMDLKIEQVLRRADALEAQGSEFPIEEALLDYIEIKRPTFEDYDKFLKKYEDKLSERSK